MEKGRFLKAPLIYVVAQIRLNFLELTDDQKIKLGQSLMSTVYRNKVSSNQKVKQLDVNKGSFDDINLARDCYMNHNHTECLVFNYFDKLIEFRSSNYINSNQFLSQLFDALSKIFEAVPEFKKLPLAEVSFHYVDLVIPLNNRPLEEYFREKKLVLPLSPIIDHHLEDTYQAGLMKFTRIKKEKNTKLEVEISQLPQSSKKFLPDALIESDNSFAMPLTFKIPFGNIKRSEYAMVWSVASKAVKDDLSLGAQELKQYCAESHTLAKETFENLIDRSVCDQDWEWEKQEIN